MKLKTQATGLGRLSGSKVGYSTKNCETGYRVADVSICLAFKLVPEALTRTDLTPHARLKLLCLTSVAGVIAVLFGDHTSLSLSKTFDLLPALLVSLQQNCQQTQQ